MSLIQIDEAKQYLRVIHDDDDAMIQMLLDGAEDEALQFLNRESFDFDDDEETSDQIMPPVVKLGCLILLQAAYETSPSDAEQLRKVAEVKLMPYRIKLGV